MRRRRRRRELREGKILLIRLIIDYSHIIY